MSQPAAPEPKPVACALCGWDAPELPGICGCEGCPLAGAIERRRQALLRGFAGSACGEPELRAALLSPPKPPTIRTRTPTWAE